MDEEVEDRPLPLSVPATADFAGTTVALEKEVFEAGRFEF
jgi:hypothetical protein